MIRCRCGSYFSPKTAAHAKDKSEDRALLPARKVAGEK